MKNILLIGVGGTGSRAVDIFYQKYHELGNQTGNNITALVFDTDAGDVQKITSATPVVMADPASVGTICDRIGKVFLKEWFPCDDNAVRSQEMIRGASQWRKKSYLAFLNLMNKNVVRGKFIGALEKMVADPGASCEIYVIASIAGGTGSGSFIPIALYAKRYLRKTLGKDPIVNAMIALPDIYADNQTSENKIKVYSNAYAILRELNAINLVSRNYNAGRTSRKKAPIRFRIGHPDEPNVGVLFDASDKQFWTPEAAPFSQIFLLDRIPRLSVTAHDIVLADSLYTILCTEIGAAFESEFSNHELLRSQNNGSNAIYAGISTSQLRFPKESILEYLAYKKTEDATNSEWMTLHKQVENKIKEKEREAKEMRRAYTPQPGEYAGIVVESYQELDKNGNDSIVSIVERGTALYDKKGNKLPATRSASFIKTVCEFINGKLPSEEDIIQKLKDAFPQDASGVSKDDVAGLATASLDTLKKYFKDCVESISKATTGTTDAILTLDKKKADFYSDAMSLRQNLLCKKGKYIHPVAALVELCRFRLELLKEIDNSLEEWKELTSRTTAQLPERFMNKISGGEKHPENAEKSGYFTLAAENERFSVICNDTESYTKLKKTKVATDLEVLRCDVSNIASKIHEDAQEQLRFRVLTRLASDVDLLIEKYRAFFVRFEKEKEELAEQTKNALRKDSKPVDSVINIYSSEEDKKAIAKTVFGESGPASSVEVEETDNAVGEGVYQSAYNSAAAAKADDNSWDEKDSGAYRSLFKNMVDAHRKQIEKSESYMKIASYNVVEAIIASCEARKEDKTKDLGLIFSNAQQLAVPSLRVNTSEDLADLVQPSNVMVFMMSQETGKYLKKHADELGLHLPADQTKESDVIKSCAEQFIRTYSGASGARVSIVKDLSDQVLYCTGEIMDITPLRIAKFDELGSDNIYFKNYCRALENQKKFDTDMWNPHLGYNLQKRGFLPYMNEKKELECDEKLVKALLWAFKKRLITYKKAMSERDFFFFCGNNRVEAPDGGYVTSKNIAQLLGWLRNEDEKIELWSAQFDADINTQLSTLPSLASDNPSEIKALEQALTKSEFMKMLTECLYEDTQESAKKSSKKITISDGKIAEGKRVGPTVLEFAYMVKTSEECERDCDDAERILSVVYKIFVDFCSYRANPVENSDRFIQVYGQQLGKIYEALASCSVIVGAGKDCKAHFTQLVSWLNYADTFNAISVEVPRDEKGNVCINSAFDYSSDKRNEVARILRYICNGEDGGEFDVEEAPEAPAVAEVSEETDAE